MNNILQDNIFQDNFEALKLELMNKAYRIVKVKEKLKPQVLLEQIVIICMKRQKWQNVGKSI